MRNYYEWDAFKNIYVEDGFVLEIEESEKEICFKVELILAEAHPAYSSPRQDEQYCYKTAKIKFKNLRKSKWLRRSAKSFMGADGGEDYGNIDFFELTPEGYHLLGDWGEVIICSEAPDLEWVS